MKMLRFVLLLLVAVGIAVAPAVAQKSQDFWHLSNFTNPKTQRFEYCAVESGFDNGLSLAFARNRESLTNIIVGFSEPKLEEKTKYKLLVGIDGHAPTEITGFAADPKALVIPLQKDKKVLAELRAGNLLEVKGPQDAIKFSLNGAAKAFDQLQDCVDKSLKEETHKAPLPTSEPAKRALTVLSQTAPTPGGSLAGIDEVEPLPLPTEPVPALKTPVLAAAAASAAEPAPLPPVVEPAAPVAPPTPAPVIASVNPLPPVATVAPPPVQPEPPAQVQPQTQPQPPARLVDTVPTPPRVPVQSASLTQKTPAPLPPVQAPTPVQVAVNQPPISPVPPAIPAVRTTMPVQAMVDQPPAPPAMPAQAPALAPAPAPAPAPVPQGLQSAPYDQIVVVPDNPAVASKPQPSLAVATSVAPTQPVAAPLRAAPVPVARSLPAPVIASPVVTPPPPMAVSAPVTAVTPAQPAAVSPPSSPVAIMPPPPPPVSIIRPSAPHAFSSLALPAVLAGLRLPAKKEKSAPKNSERFYWHEGDLAGTAAETPAARSFLDQMLIAVDAMEKSCKTAFSSDLGAPTKKAGLVYAEAVIGCGNGSSAIQGAVLFYQTQGKFVVFTEQGQPISRALALQRRENLKDDLLLSTNYK